MLPKHLVLGEIYVNQANTLLAFPGGNFKEEPRTNTSLQGWFSFPRILTKDSLLLFTGEKMSYRYLTPYDKPGIPLRSRQKIRMYQFFSFQFAGPVWIAQSGLEAHVWPHEKQVAKGKKPAKIVK